MTETVEQAINRLTGADPTYEWRTVDALTPFYIRLPDRDRVTEIRFERIAFPVNFQVRLAVSHAHRIVLLHRLGTGERECLPPTNWPRD